jgi:hypothetical protein
VTHVTHKLMRSNVLKAHSVRLQATVPQAYAAHTAICAMVTPMRSFHVLEQKFANHFSTSLVSVVSLAIQPDLLTHLALLVFRPACPAKCRFVRSRDPRQLVRHATASLRMSAKLAQFVRTASMSASSSKLTSTLRLIQVCVAHFATHLAPTVVMDSIVWLIG